MFFDNFLILCDLKKVAPTKAVVDAGLPKSSWSYWKKKYEQGEDPKPSSDNTSKLANYFGVTVDYLLTGKEPTRKEEPDRLLPAGLDTSGMSKEQLEILYAVTKTMQESEDGEERLRHLLTGAGIIKK